MRTKKITMLLVVTVVSLLTMFLVFLLDDSVLAEEIAGSQGLQNLYLWPTQAGAMMVDNLVQLQNGFVLDEL